ncbi:MAG TPA: hypothetical protein DCF78_07735, partial [Dehalococcoidia bacterium]|nr:hypothetical protein [Dehalococcoidia bacterium]
MTLIKPSKRQTLSNYAADAWSDDSRYEGLNAIVQAIADGADQIEEKIRAATLADIIGTSGEVNVQGEIVQYLDTAASDTFVDVLSKSGRVAAIGSEEIEETVIVGDS